MGISEKQEFDLMDEVEREAFLESLTPEDLPYLESWAFHGRPEQQEPEGNWKTWLFLAGRGAGKTRCAAEWVKSIIDRHRSSGKAHVLRFAFVARTASDARETMIEGDSGILSVYGDGEQKPLWESSKKQVTWKDGVRLLAIANIYYGNEPERCRGPNVHYAWADETCSWAACPDTWSNLMLMLRKEPARCIVTTTPKKVPWLKTLLDRGTTQAHGPMDVFVTGGSTYDNLDNLAESFASELLTTFEGTTLGEQELHAKINWDEVPGALWSTTLLESTRVRAVTQDRLRRTVVAIDPAGTSNRKSDLTGIVAVAAGSAPDPASYSLASEAAIVRNAALLGKPHGYVLADRSGRYSPAVWPRVALDLLYEVDGDCLVAEINMGGEMVEQCIRSVLRPGEQMPRIKTVHSKVGKKIRAEPVVALFEQGRFHMVGLFADMEAQLTSWVPMDGQPSPDRMDALVHGATELFPSLLASGSGTHGQVGGKVGNYSGGFQGLPQGQMSLGALIRM